MNRKISYLITVIIVFSIIFELFAKKTGIAGETGSPNEGTCYNVYGCHATNALNSGSGSLSISSDIPATGYIPSSSYTVKVTVRYSGRSLFGFAMEALNSSNNNAGVLSIISSTTTQILTAFNGRKNVTHTQNGGVSNDSMVFSFGWQAPAANTGNVTFYAGGNAADNSGTQYGDYVYTTSQSISEKPRITTGFIAGSPFCEGKTGIVIPFTKSGIFNSGNVFTAQLSDDNGSFSSPTDIGTRTATTAGSIISNVALPQIAGTKYRIRVVASDPAITGSTSTTDLTISLPPSASNAGNDQTICTSTTTLSANTPSTGTGTWSVISGSGTIAGANDPSSDVSSLGSGLNTFVWTINSGGCTATKDTVIINSIVNPSVANAGPDKIACSNSTTFDGNTPADGTGIWTLVNGAGSITDPSDPKSIVSGLGSGSNTFAWTITNAPCAFSSDTVIITQAGTITPSNAGNDQSLCTDSTLLTGNMPVIGTGSWSLITGAGIIKDPLDPASSVSALGTGQNVFRWSIVNTPCSPSTDDVVISVSGKPASNAGANQTVCTNFTNLAADVPLHGTGSWTILSGAGTITDLSDPASAVTALGNGTNTFIWTVTNTPCDPASDTVEIFRTGTISIANAGTDQNICLASATLAGNTPVTGAGMWSLISGSAIITDPSNPLSTVTGLGTGTYVFRWTITSAPCIPTTDEITIENCSNHSIVTGNISGSPFCEESSYSVIVPFTSTGIYTENFIAELSDKNGSFTSPVNIGSGTGSPILANIPALTAPGHDYRIRVTNAILKGEADPDTLSINTCNTGVKKNSEKSSFNVYPNPNIGAFDIQFGNDMQGEISLIIYNMMGERILLSELRAVSAGETRHFELQPNIKGILFVLLQTESQVRSSRVIVQ